MEGRTESDLLRRTRVDIDRSMLVVAKAHPPVQEISPGRPDISSLRWIVREAGSGTREVLHDLTRGMGIPFDALRIFLVLPSNEAVARAVEAGAGATIISQLVVGRAVAEGVLRNVSLDLPKREFALISHRDRQATTSQGALRSFLLEASSGPR
ncbi:LysR substrate-binding domain-containing protein [Mesorhizobium sp. ZMM04-4]